ncbi:MAG: DNA repair protein RadC [Acidobacteriia bacterium]|nr:DNA repair protein RadC [Terriglobia bacterium]
MRIREISVKYLPSDVPLKKGEAFGSPGQVYEAFKDLILEPTEVFVVLCLDTKHRMLFVEKLYKGTVDSCPVYPREVFWSAVYHRSSAIICLHNHPSGDPTPSAADKRCTEDLFRAGEVLAIRLLDHIIVGEDRYFSLAEHGLLS